MEDGRTRYNKICKLLKPIVGETKSMGDLQRRVMIDIGSSPNVIRETLQLAIDLGLIKETSDMVFKIVRCEAKI